MFERYTEAARRTLFFARYEVSLSGATEIGPEHLLLGLIREPEGLVGRILAEAKISRQVVRRDIEEFSTAGARIATSVEVPFGNQTQAVLRAAAEEADRLSHSHIGNEHLLLGLLRVEQSQAASVLTSRGLRLDDVRHSIATLLGDSPVPVEAPPPASATRLERPTTFDLRSVPRTDPVAIYRVRDGLYAADMLLTAIVHLDLFSWLGQNPATIADVCRAFGTTERPTDVMLTLFAAMGFVEERQNVFHLTPLASEHLVKSSPWFLGPYYESLKNRPVALDLLEVLRTGKPANWGSQKDGKDWHVAMETEEFAAQFTAAMDCRGVYLAQAVAKSLDLSWRSHLLDIAGGSGVYACSLVTHHPHLAATVFEKPPVDAIAARAIANRGCSGKVGVVAGDMLTGTLPADADVHLYSNVLHDWDEPVVRQLIEKSFAALPAGGLIVIHDAFLNAAKNGPLHVAEYSVLLMHSSEGRCYSTREMARYLTDAGFRDASYRDTAAARGVMTATR